jgi:hypothetical protein
MRFLEDFNPQAKRFCSIEPMTMMALGGMGAGALGSIGKSLGGMFGGQDAAEAAREAAKEFIAYQERERKKFLDTNRPIYDRLKNYATGNVGYDADTLRGMKDQVTEDYGQGLSDVSRISANSAMGKNSGGGNVYTPGRYDRTTRLLGQNLAMNKAKMMRDINQRNAEMANSNMRWATSAIPTFSEGYAATPQIGYDAFQGKHSVAPVGNYIGQMFGDLGQMGMPFMNAGAQGAMLGPIAAKLRQARSDGGVSTAGSIGKAPVRHIWTITSFGTMA